MVFNKDTPIIGSTNEHDIFFQALISSLNIPFLHATGLSKSGHLISLCTCINSHQVGQS
jgi:hypothetical protein